MGLGERHNKLTKAARVARIQEVINLISMGFSRQDIRRYTAKNTNWNVPDRCLDRYLAEAREQLEKLAAEDAKYELGVGKARLNELYKRAFANKDYKAALAAQKERHELLGLKKHDHNLIRDIKIRVVHEPVQDQETPGGVSSEYDGTD